MTKCMCLQNFSDLDFLNHLTEELRDELKFVYRNFVEPYGDVHSTKVANELEQHSRQFLNEIRARIRYVRDSRTHLKAHINIVYIKLGIDFHWLQCRDVMKYGLLLDTLINHCINVMDMVQNLEQYDWSLPNE